MRELRWMVLATVLLATACVPAVDLEYERAGLLERDREWSNTLPDLDALLSFFDAEASFLPENMPIATGSAAIRDVFETIASLPGFALHWTPAKADVSRAGDMGYTQGTYEMTVDDPSGTPVTTTGKYVTVWKRHIGGPWLVVADIFNPDAPPPAPAATEPTRP